MRRGKTLGFLEACGDVFGRIIGDPHHSSWEYRNAIREVTREGGAPFYELRAMLAGKFCHPVPRRRLKYELFRIEKKREREQQQRLAK